MLIMALRNQKRRVGQIDFAENGSASLELPRKYPFRSLELNVIGSLVIGTAGTPVLYTGGAFGSAFRVLHRLEVIANGRDTIKSLSGSALAMKNLFHHGSGPQEVEAGLTAATHPFGGNIRLDFGMPRSVRPADTFLDSGRLSTFELRATFGTGTDMFSTNPTAITSTDCDIEVHVAEAIRLDNKEEPYSTYKELYIEKAVTAAATEFQILLPVGNRYRGFMLEAQSDGEMVNTVINSIQIRSGTDVFFKAEGDVVQAMNVIDHNLKQEALTGYYYVDFCPDGRLVDALNARNLSQLEMILDVAAPGTTDIVRIYPDEIVSPV
jgi:hypothetical protein